MMVTKIAALLAEAEGQINNDLPTVDQVAEYLVEHGVILKEDGCVKKINWRWDMGVYVAFCPYCDELVYEQDRCVFCGKPYEYVEGKHKPTIVEEGEYTIVQATNNHIQLYKEDRMVMHMSCRKKKTEDELRSTIELYEALCRKGADNEQREAD